MYTNQTFVGHIFCNNLKANGKILLAFCWGNQCYANFYIGLYIIPVALDQSTRYAHLNLCGLLPVSFEVLESGL